MPNRKFSIIIPCYNAGKTILHTIESVVNQTYDDFEVIVIDDASTDNSGEIINSYQSSKIRILTNDKNMGRSRSRNLGIQHAKGEYLFFLDADDLLDKEHLATFHKYITDNRPASNTILGSNFAYFNSFWHIRWVNEINNRYNLEEILIGDRLPAVPVLCHNAVFLKRSGVIFPVGIEAYEDWLFLMECGRKNITIQSINNPKPLAFIRVHKNNTMGKGLKMAQGLKSIYNHIMPTLTEHQKIIFQKSYTKNLGLLLGPCAIGNLTIKEWVLYLYLHLRYKIRSTLLF